MFFRYSDVLYKTVIEIEFLNTDVFLGHDSVIGSFNVFNPSTRISGEVIIGDHNFFGVSSVLLQQKRIGNKTTIGANSVIIKKLRIIILIMEILQQL